MSDSTSLWRNALSYITAQNLALRGHHESMESLDRDNFLEILELVAGHDETNLKMDQEIPFIHPKHTKLSDKHTW